jgi:hypothetical protein
MPFKKGHKLLKKGPSKETIKLAPTHKIKLGKMDIYKSNKDGMVNYAWDVVQKCQGVDCPAATQCPHVKDLLTEDDCKIMKNYMRSVSKVMYEAQSDNISSAQRYQIGMHIIPLYKTLCKMKIAELGIGNVTERTPRGTYQVNPIYKEMREIIKVIDQVWKSIGVRQGGGLGDMKPDFAPKGQTGGNYYDAMEKEAFATMPDNVTAIRKKKE